MRSPSEGRRSRSGDPPSRFAQLGIGATVSVNNSAEEPDQSDLPLVIWVVPLLGAIVTPSLVWSVADRPMAVRIDLAVGTAIGVAIFAVALLAVVSRGFRHRARWSLSVAAIGTLVFFQWPLLTFAGNDIADTVSLPLLANLIPVLIAVALLWLATRNGGEWQFATIIGSAISVIVLTLLIMAMPFVERASATPRGEAAPDSPDVLLLVLDGYSRADTLQEEFGFDNTAFLQDLEELGFTVATEAQANYGYTYASLSTMLNLDYVFDLGTISDDERAVMRNALSGNAPMLDRFRRAGYETAVTENGWEGSHCGAAVDVCIREGLLERVLWRLGQVTIFAPVVKSTRPHPFHSVSYEQLESLPSYALDGRTDGVPRLTISHLILPHPPFLRDGQCDYHSSAIRRSFATERAAQIDVRRDFYTEQLTCTNRKVIDAMREIVAAMPDSIIMITGDHGSATSLIKGTTFDTWTDDGLLERINVLSAYRLPGCEDEPHSSITPVNGTRLVTNCALGTGLSPLPDRVLWLTPDGKADVIAFESLLEGSSR